jgi:phage-related tail fiber protein
MLDGKQLKDASVASAKLATAFVNDLLRAASAVNWLVDQNAGGQKLTNLGAPVSGSDAARLQDVQNIPWKQVCRAATTANITLSGAQTIDGVSIVAGDRVLVKNQTTQSQNGIYLCASGAWTRTTDGDSTFELNAAVVPVGDEGTANAAHRYAQTTVNPTVGSSNIVWVDIGSGAAPGYPVTSNKNMAASLTSADFQSACATTLVSSPANHGYIQIYVNGMHEVLGDGVKTKSCYFSADGGTTARTFATIAAGDTLYWVGSVAGYQLATTDIIDFDYTV